MNAFPENFTPDFLAQREKYNADIRDNKIMANFQRYFAECDKPNIPYCYDIERFDVHRCNKFISLIRNKESYFGEGIKVICRQRAFCINNMGIGDLAELEFRYYDSNQFAIIIKEHMNDIRQKIVNKMEEKTGPKYSFVLEKEITKAVEPVLEELKKLGWKIEANDLWEHVNDDYCVMELTITS